MKTKIKYRILKSDKTFLNAGSDLNSWFTLTEAIELVKYEDEQIIVEHDGVNILWEVL